MVHFSKWLALAKQSMKYDVFDSSMHQHKPTNSICVVSVLVSQIFCYGSSDSVMGLGPMYRLCDCARIQAWCLRDNTGLVYL
jgi:hypothetical protein